jgi:hypothetical protein
MLNSTEHINSLIRRRVLHTSATFDRKTYWCAASYRKVAETGDLRYDYAYSIIKKWPGGTVDEWVSKMPLEINGRLIDYGRGANKITSQFRELTLEELYDYDYFHTINADHIIPKSYAKDLPNKGWTFENCRIISKAANIARQNLDKERLREAINDIKFHKLV